uniref:FAD dependent oxidoreductase domain-containing protein n=1 Tax=Chromera velia CCMP2878 TaxID=1169474 RepID=A0A0G4GW04_9ALVE|eukprot:Cvel_5274.t1-p1 / transcript=Cvel_5274.t1 / gene=Cvel_5274 / organism=Chromera_velia_CCMP2878 / gene_product=hypothetical protein / transcript_product=hypothetical protein / location=Cvel_scaffold243:88603-90572(+) / protein_length=622 / sequence_SO=supercontig / SO=protein_coding / is_pseudo=false
MAAVERAVRLGMRGSSLSVWSVRRAPAFTRAFSLSSVKEGPRRVAVVGGGALGLLSAYFLSKNPRNSVLILDENNRIGDGAAFGNAGFVIVERNVRPLNGLGWMMTGLRCLLQGDWNFEMKAPIDRHGASWLWRYVWEVTQPSRVERHAQIMQNLAEESRRLFEEIQRECSEFQGCSEPIFQKKGMAEVAFTQQRWRALQTEYTKLRAEGMGVELLGRDELKKRVPLVQNSALGALLVSEGTHMDPQDFFSRLTTHLRNLPSPSFAPVSPETREGLPSPSAPVSDVPLWSRKVQIRSAVSVRGFRLSSPLPPSPYYMSRPFARRNPRAPLELLSASPGLFSLSSKGDETGADGRRVEAVVTNEGEEIEVDDVVLAAGVGNASLCGSLGSPLPLLAADGYHLDLDAASLPPSLGRQGCSPSSASSYLEFPLGSDKFVTLTPMNDRVRATAHMGLKLSHPDSLLQKEGRREAEERTEGVEKEVMARMVPAVASVTGLSETEVRNAAVSAWKGERPCLPDFLPLVCRLPLVSNAVLAGGHGKLGITMGAASAQRASVLAGGRVGEGVGETQRVRQGGKERDRRDQREEKGRPVSASVSVPPLRGSSPSPSDVRRRVGLSLGHEVQ